VVQHAEEARHLTAAVGNLEDLQTTLEIAQADVTNNSQHDQITILRDKCQEELVKAKSELTNCRKQLRECRELNNRLNQHNMTLTNTINDLRQMPENTQALALANCVRNNERLNDEKDVLMQQLNQCKNQLRLAVTTPQDHQNIQQLSQALQHSAALADTRQQPITSTPAHPVGLAALHALQRQTSVSSASSTTSGSLVVPKTPPRANPATEPVRYMHDQTITNLGIADTTGEMNPKQFIYDPKAVPKFSGDKADNGINKWLQSFENHCRLAGLEPRTKALLLYTKTEGSARVALDNLKVRDPTAMYDVQKLSLELLRVYSGQAQMARMHANLAKLKQDDTIAGYNTKFSEIVTEMGGIAIPGAINSGNQIGVMQAITNYRQGLKSPIQRALVAQNFTDLSTLQQAALDVEQNLSALIVNSPHGSNNDPNIPITCSRCGSTQHRRTACKERVHCTHCVGEGHNTKVCFKKFPHLQQYFNKPTNSAASSPSRPVPVIQRPQHQQRKPGATAYVIQQPSAYVVQQSQQHQVVTNTSSQPIPPAPSSNYCHYHNTWSHGDTSCSLQQQTHAKPTATPYTAQTNNNTQKPRVPIAQVECYNCHQKGHYRNKCPLPQQTVGCTNLDNNLRFKPTICTYVSNWTNITQSPVDTWEELQVIIDTGSDINLVDSNLVTRLGLHSQIEAPSTPVSQLNGEELQIIGRILLPVSVGSPTVMTTQQWFDVNNYGLNILGTPFLKSTQSVPDLANNRFFVNNYASSVPLHIEQWPKNDKVADNDQINSVPVIVQAVSNIPAYIPAQPTPDPVVNTPPFYPVSNGQLHQELNPATTPSAPITVQVSPTVNLLTGDSSVIQPATADQQQMLDAIKANARKNNPVGLALLEKQGDGYDFTTLPGKSTATSIQLLPVEADGNCERLGIGYSASNASATKAAKLNISKQKNLLDFAIGYDENNQPTMRVCTNTNPLIAFVKPSETPVIQLSNLQIVDTQVNTPALPEDLTEPQATVMATFNEPAKDEKLRFLKNVPKEHQARLKSIIDNYQAKIRPDQPSTLKEVTLKINPDAKPIVQRKRRHTLVNNEVIKKEVDKLYNKGVIRRSDSAWSAELVVAPKPNGGKRVCVDFTDFTDLNEETEPNNYGLRNIDHLISRFSNFKVASKIDLSAAFQQIRLNPNSVKYTAFRTDEGLWEYTTMPYGLRNAPGDFQIRIDDIFHEELQTWLINYLDDFNVPSTSYEDHLDKLELLFTKLADNNILVQPEKCDFFVEKFNFLGHYISPTGIQPQKEYLAKALAFQKPSTKQQLQSWLGVINWIDQYIPGCRSRVSRIQPLIHGLEAEDPVTWTNEADAQFIDINNVLTQQLELAHFQTDRPSHRVADASGTAVGGVLFQEQGPVSKLKGIQIDANGKETPPTNVRVVRWCSKTLSKSQQKWPISTRELYAQQVALKNFSLWTAGGTTYNWTDHKGLTQRLSLDEETNRDSIKVQACMSYNTIFKYLPGCTNNPNIIALPDAISRLCLALARDPPSDDVIVPPEPAKPAHTAPKTTSYINFNGWGGELLDLISFAEIIPDKATQVTQQQTKNNANSSEFQDIESNPGPWTWMQILIMLFGDGKTKRQKKYQQLNNKPAIMLLFLTLLSLSSATPICPPTISGTYQIISSSTQLYQDFEMIKIDYQQQGYHICHWDTTLVANTANCTIEGRHINVLPTPFSKIEPSVKHVITAIRQKEIVIFAVKNETTISLGALKIVSRVIRIPKEPIDHLQIIQQNLIFPTTISTTKSKWNDQCLRHQHYSTAPHSLDSLTWFIEKNWCQNIAYMQPTPQIGWQYYKLGNLAFGCSWPIGKFPSNIGYSTNQQEQKGQYKQWLETVDCMNAAPQNSFPALISLQKMPKRPTQLECLWFAGGKSIKWKNSTVLHTLPYTAVNTIFRRYINPNITHLKSKYTQCFIKAITPVIHDDVAHIYLAEPTPGAVFDVCINISAIYAQPQQTSVPMLLVIPKQHTQQLYSSNTPLLQYGIPQFYHVCLSNHSWHIPLLDLKITKWQKGLTKIARDWVDQSTYYSPNACIPSFSSLPVR